MLSLSTAPVGDLLLAVLVGLVEFWQQGLEDFGVVDEFGAAAGSEGKIEFGKIPRDFAADSRRGAVRDIRQPVDERFGCDCEARIGENECAVSGVGISSCVMYAGIGMAHMRMVLMTVFRFRMMARKSWVN